MSLQIQVDKTGIQPYQEDKFLQTFNVVPAGTIFMIADKDVIRPQMVASLYRIFLDKSRVTNHQQYQTIDPYLRLTKKSMVMLLDNVSLESSESEIGESLLVPCVITTSSSTRVGHIKYADFMAILDYTLGIITSYNIEMVLPLDT